MARSRTDQIEVQRRKCISVENGGYLKTCTVVQVHTYYTVVVLVQARTQKMNLGRGWYYQILILVVYTDECVFMENVFLLSPTSHSLGTRLRYAPYLWFLFLAKIWFWFCLSVLCTFIVIFLYLTKDSGKNFKREQFMDIHVGIFFRELINYFQLQKRQQYF